jgi:formylglycine-generating enzyme required for sulfatase activity
VQTRKKDGMEMAYVPAGEFLMGTSDADAPPAWNEKPEHTLYLDAFWIDRTEVSNAQYRRCVDAGACQAPLECSLLPESHSDPNPTYDDASKRDHPVVCVTWHHAKAYCSWVGARLPTEGEWEKAARGPDGRKYPWGNRAPDCARANFSECIGSTAPVGSYPRGASAYGVLDMVGNVLEWVSTRWAESPYDPYDGREDQAEAGVRVQRSCRYWDPPAQAKPTYRYGGVASNKYEELGFRCARSVSEQP